MTEIYSFIYGEMTKRYPLIYGVINLIMIADAMEKCLKINEEYWEFMEKWLKVVYLSMEKWLNVSSNIYGEMNMNQLY